MIRVDFDPTTFFENGKNQELKASWDGHVEKARVATEEIIREWEAHKLRLGEWQRNPAGEKRPEFIPTFADKVWKGFKEWFEENIFHFKCAYCEASLLEESKSDAEHFRPKREIVVESATAKTTDEDGVEIVHPGY